MGLDSVELLVDIENKFQIKFTDYEAEKINTVGDFYKAILNKIELKPQTECNSQKLFYRLRQMFSIYTDISPKEIYPTTELSKIISKNNRKETWNTFQNSFSFKIPDLKRPEKLISILEIISMCIFLLSFSAILISISELNLTFFLIALMLISFMSMAWIVTKPFKKNLPLLNMRDLVETILVINSETFEMSSNNKSEILLLLKGAIQDKCGLDYEEIKLDATITNDLGIN